MLSNLCIEVNETKAFRHLFIVSTNTRRRLVNTHPLLHYFTYICWTFSGFCGLGLKPLSGNVIRTTVNKGWNSSESVSARLYFMFSSTGHKYSCIWRVMSRCAMRSRLHVRSHVHLSWDGLWEEGRERKDGRRLVHMDVIKHKNNAVTIGGGQICFKASKSFLNTIFWNTQYLDCCWFAFLTNIIHRFSTKNIHISNYCCTFSTV